MDAERTALSAELEDVALQLVSVEPDAEVAVVLVRVRDEYERLKQAAGMYDWPELGAVLDWVLGGIRQPDAPVTALLAQGRFVSWLELTALALQEPEDAGHLGLLVAELTDADWPEPLDIGLLQAFLLSLRVAVDEAPEAPDQVPATPVLAFSPGIHPELLQAYLDETPAQVTELAQLLHRVAAGEASAALRAQAARLAHTIKGASGVVGVDAIAGFTHRLEDVLEFPLTPVPEGLGPVLEAAADCLETMYEQLQGDGSLPPEQAGLDQALQHWIGQLAGVREAAAVPSLADEAALRDVLAALGQEAADDERGAAVAAGGEAVPEGPGLPVRQERRIGEDRIQRLLNLAGELITSSSHSAELLLQARQLGKQLYQQDEQVRLRLEELEGQIGQQERELVSGTAQRREAVPGALALEAYSDVQGTVNLLVEAVADSRELAGELDQRVRRLTDELYQQQRIQRLLGEVVLSARLVPFGQLVPRLERIVRETCRRTGRQAGITVHGQQVQVDGDILKGLSEALLHLLRNAVDHGIEAPKARSAQGKPDAGRITLDVSRRGNDIMLALEDDGAGLDAAAIRARAIERGLLGADEAITDEEALRLLLLPGFSTRDAVSDVSGRGVGLDVVRVAVENLRGTLELSGTPGQGSRFRIRVPQTLIATHALVVAVGEHLLAIPADAVEQLLFVTPEQCHQDENGQWQIDSGRYRLPVTALGDLLGWPGAEFSAERTHTLVICRSEKQVYALQVDEVLPSRDIVLKTLAPWLSQVPNIQGACILANGAVAVVLDMSRLLHEFEHGRLTRTQPESAAVLPVRAAAVASLLVVDDSLSNRKSMQLMLEGLGYRVLTAVDGLDALQLLNEQAVDMVLTDMEMPRMNGLEMTQAIRIWPEKRHLPVIMVTSRTTRKHRDMARQAGVDGYLTKPVQRPVLEQQLQKWLGTQLAVA
ncbi:MAG: response regulator [Thiothrix sp.]|nr:response regulator [Thiothrix sp.]